MDSLFFWIAILPLNMGFHLLTNNQLCHSTQTQRSCRRIHLKAFWESSSTSSSSNEESCEEDQILKEEKGIKLDIKSISKESESSKTDSKSSTNKSLLSFINEIGNNFKDMAEKSTSNGLKSKDQYKKIYFAAKACFYYTIFIIYRSYRGCFILLPVTVRQVYIKMDSVMNTGNLSMLKSYDETNVTVRNSIDWRTKLTVSILTSVVTMSYIFGCAQKMVTNFFQTLLKTSNITESFEAAADEIVNFEGRIGRVGKIN